MIGALVTAEHVATVTGGGTVAAVLAIGAVARRGPVARSLEPSSVETDDTTPRRISRTGVAAVMVVLAAAVALLGPVVAAVGGLSVVGAGHRRGRSKTRQRELAVETTFPDAVELLVLCLHAGRSPIQAVRELAMRGPPPVRPGFAAVVGQLERGAGLADALSALPATLGPCAREVAAAIAAADREGLALAPVLDRLAADARTARRRLGDAAARRLPVRLSFPLVACTLPAFVLLALAPALLGALSTLRGNAP